MIGGHGHVTPRLDGMRARCGGPGLCAQCSAERAQRMEPTASDYANQPPPIPPDLPPGMPPYKWADMNRAERRAWKRGER